MSRSSPSRNSKHSSDGLRAPPSYDSIRPVVEKSRVKCLTQEAMENKHSQRRSSAGVLETLTDGDNTNVLQQLAMLTFMSNPDKGKHLVQGLLAIQLCQKAVRHLSKADQMDELRNETIANIATYIKEHPRVRPSELQAKVEDEINLFKRKLQAVT